MGRTTDKNLTSNVTKKVCRVFRCLQLPSLRQNLFLSLNSQNFQMCKVWRGRSNLDQNIVKGMWVTI